MNILKRIGVGIRLFKDAVTLGQLPRGYFGFGGRGRSMLARVSTEMDPGNLTGWAYFATNKVASRVSQMELELYRLSPDGSVEQIFDHDVLAAFYRANATMTSRDLFKIMCVFIYIWGSAPLYVEYAKDKKTILSIWPVRPDLLKFNTDDLGNLTGYTYKIGKRSVNFNTDEILNIREPNPLNPHLGSSRILSAALEIDQDIQAAIWNKYLIENSAEPGGVLETDGELTDEAYNRIEQAWEARQQGTSNVKRVAILELGLKYSKVSQTQQELDFNESRKLSKDTILTLLGVPTSLINDTANRANAETAERVFNRETIEPIMELITAQISEFLLPRFGEDLWLTYQEPTPDDAESRRLDNMASVNVWKTINEVRQTENLPPLEGGDFLYRSFSDVPTIGDDIPDFTEEEIPDAEKRAAIRAFREKMANAKGAMEAKQKPGFISRKHLKIKSRIQARSFLKRKIVNTIVERGIEKLNAKMSAAKEVKTIILVKNKDVTDQKKSEKKDDDPFGGLKEPVALERKAYLARLPKLISRFKKKIRPAFDDFEDEVLKNLDQAGEPPKSNGTNIETKAKSWLEAVVGDKKKLVEALIKVTASEYVANVVTGGEDIATLMGVPFEDFVAMPSVVKFMKEKPVKMAGLVADTTLDDLKRTLSEGLANGDSIGQMGDRIAKTMDMARGFRSETIARTEVGSSLNFGRNEQMAVQGVEKKEWVAIFSNTRDDHAEAHGQVVNVKDSFEVGGESLEFPQDPKGSAANVINCQCSAAPVFD